MFPVYYYNFIWRDYGGAATDKLLDMVKVVAFAVQEGRVAIHCHAGKLIDLLRLNARHLGDDEYSPQVLSDGQRSKGDF